MSNGGILLFFLAGDLALVFLISVKINKYWKIPKIKLILGACLSVPAGLIGSSVIRLIEFGSWRGLSYCGVILVSPIIMLLIGLLLKTEPKAILDIGAPVACAVLPLMKLHCFISDCCIGRIVRRLPNGRVIRFPSQLVEMACGIILLFVILRIEKSEKQRGYVYAWFLLLYGCSRFVLTFLRETRPFVLGLPGGSFWSLIAIIIGGSVLLVKRYKEAREIHQGERPLVK